MAKITINLNNPQSIASAKATLIGIRKSLVEIRENFFEDVANWIINRANEYVDKSDIGSEIKREIKGGWNAFEKTPKGLKITNSAKHAVFVEFGVGYEGYIDKHPNASVEGYKYNVGKKINKNTNIWIFNVGSDEEIDIDKDYIVRRGETSVSTRGQPALLFLYNAIMDCKTEGVAERLWKENFERYSK